MIRNKSIFIIIMFVVLSGCSNQVLVPYNNTEKNNWVTVILSSGNKIQGTVLDAKPHLLTIRTKEGQSYSIETSRIQEVKRIPPFYDDFGNAISEEEINHEKTNKNATIYGIGGGLLSFGASFFTGSMIAKGSENGGATLAATTGVGGTLGTILFVQAGKRQDRKDAVQKIQSSRKSTQIKRSGSKSSLEDLRKEVIEEKRKQEELRKQREQLLRELEESKKKDE